MFMQIAGEAIISSYNHLKRICRNDGEGVGLCCSNARNPEEAMSTRNSSNWGLSENDTGPALKERCDRGGISNAVYREFEESQEPICDPDRRCKDNDDKCLFRDVWSVHANCNQDKSRHEDMNDVESFVLEFSEQQSTGEDDKQSEACCDANNLDCVEEFVETV